VAEADIRRGLEAQARMPEGLAAVRLRGHFTYRLGDLEFHCRHYAQAAAAYTRAIDDFARVYGEDNPWSTTNIRASRGTALLFAGRYAEAADALTEAEAQYLRKLPANSPTVTRTRVYLAPCLLATGRRAEATAEAQLAAERADVIWEAGDWDRVYAHAVFGACLTADGKYAEAETHLVTAHQCLAAEDPDLSIPPGFRPVVTDTYRWTAELYEAWGKRERAAKWRAKMKERQGERGASAP
jgi:tetratricopeptide (TPR) repeat protein